MTSHLYSIRDEKILFELAKAIRLQKCVLLMGLGIALFDDHDNDESYPQKHLKELLRRMIQWCVEKKVITQDEVIDDFQTMLQNGEVEKAERKLQEYFTETSQKNQCLNETLGQNKQQVQYIYQLFSQMPFRAYVTTSYDDFLEAAYKEIHEFPVLLKYYKNSIANAVVSYQAKAPFILKLHGDVTSNSPETVTLQNRFARSYIPEAISYPEHLRALLADTYTLFVGFEKVDPDLEGLKSIVNKKDDIKRWLLIPEDHMTENEADQAWQEDKLTSVSYPDQRALVLFLRRLAEVIATPQQVEVYVSYDDNLKDRKIRHELQKHLNLVICQGLHITWTDGQISPGQEMKPVIEERLSKADLILLCISVDYMNAFNKSNIGTEMSRAVQRHELGQARVIPILFRKCMWGNASFSHLASLPPNGRPIAQASQKDSVYYDIAEAVKGAIEKWAAEH